MRNSKLCLSVAKQFKIFSVACCNEHNPGVLCGAQKKKKKKKKKKKVLPLAGDISTILMFSASLYQGLLPFYQWWKKYPIVIPLKIP